MHERYRRTPKNYDGTEKTARPIQQLLPGLFDKISRSFYAQGAAVLAAWSGVVGAEYASMTEALAFQEGVLVVKVKNSSLYALLSRYEKDRLLQALRAQLPHVAIQGLRFRLG